MIYLGDYYKGSLIFITILLGGQGTSFLLGGNSSLGALLTQSVDSTLSLNSGFLTQLTSSFFSVLTTGKLAGDLMFDFVDMGMVLFDFKGELILLVLLFNCLTSFISFVWYSTICKAISSLLTHDSLQELIISLVLWLEITDCLPDIDDVLTPACFNYWTVFCIALSYLLRSLISLAAARLSGCSDTSSVFLPFLTSLMAILTSQTNKTRRSTMRMELLVVFRNSIPRSIGAKSCETQAYLNLLTKSGSSTLQRMVQGNGMIIYVSLVNSESIINMFFKQINNKAILPFLTNKNFFSKIRKRTHRPSAPQEQQPPSFKIEDYTDYNYDNFDCLASVKKLHNAYTTNLDYRLLRQAKQLYDKMQEECTQLLRQQNEKLIIKISQGQICYQDLKKLLNLKVSMQLRFRKWDDMVLDIHNHIQAVKYETYQTKVAQKMTLDSYHKLCAIFIMSDHNQLHDLFDYESKVTPERRRKIKESQQKIKPFGFGFEAYHNLEIELMNSINLSLENCEILLLQGIGLLVLGRKEAAMRKLSIMTNLNFHKDIRQQAFISILTSLNFPAKGSKPISQKQIDNIKKGRPLTLFDAKQFAESHITVQQCEELLNSLVLHFHKKDIAQLSSKILNKYFNLLALICQSYYIQGKEEEYIRMSTLLKSKADDYLNFMLSYFEIARHVDRNDHQNAETLFTQLKASDQQLKDGIRQFYRADRIALDMLRVNLYKMGCRIYELKDDKEQFQQYLEQSVLLECKLGVYTTRQPNQQVLEGNDLTVDWRKTVSGRVPYHYLNLRLQKILAIDESIIQQQPF